MSKSKAHKRALKEATKRGRRIWREVREQAGIPKRRKAVKETITKRTVVAESAPQAPAKPLHQMTDDEWSAHTAAHWGKHPAGYALVPGYWRTGSLSDNLTQQPPAA